MKKDKFETFITKYEIVIFSILSLSFLILILTNLQINDPYLWWGIKIYGITYLISIGWFIIEKIINRGNI